MAAALVCAACAPLDPETLSEAPPEPGGAVRITHSVMTGRPFDAVFYAPDNVSRFSRYPVAIGLHGCGGVYEPYVEQWRKMLAKRGVGLIVLDSFSPRDEDSVCDDVFRISPTERVLDVLALLEYLDATPMFSRHPLFLLGASHGGTTTLLASLHPDPLFRRLRGMVAYYPWCLDYLPRINTDLLVLIGSADDWTPAERCRDMRVEPRGKDYELVIYRDATHSFDVNGVNMMYQGHRLSYHPAASRDSRRRVLEFISRRR